jgi:hypothetical protein
VNRNEAKQIAGSMLEVGNVYHFHAVSLGRCNLKFLGGSRFQVVAGFLQSQKDKKKRWNEGDELTLPNYGIGKFYELADIGEVAE